MMNSFSWCFLQHCPEPEIIPLRTLMINQAPGGLLPEEIPGILIYVLIVHRQLSRQLACRFPLVVVQTEKCYPARTPLKSGTSNRKPALTKTSRT